jgi:ABC-type sugar transport system ATPase subunit
MNVTEASGLGKRYGRSWALRECTLAIPEGHLAALVGPNGAGKTTLLNLVVGLTAPTAGTVTVLGGTRAGSLAALDGIAFVAQTAPLHKNLSVADLLHLTRNLNRRFDQGYDTARADPGAGQAAAAPRAGRADGVARPAGPLRLHGRGDERDGRRRRVGGAFLARPGRA